MGNTTKGLDLGETIRNGKPEVRGFESKAAPQHLQDEFDLLNEFQFTSTYRWKLETIIEKLRVRKLIG